MIKIRYSELQELDKKWPIKTIPTFNQPKTYEERHSGNKYNDDTNT